jgi:DNA repair exonuclease SbcCD ATPase subunit
MDIKLKSLMCNNFKGIKHITINADGKNISIFGDNGTGKTSLFDAFLWLLFDKDSSNRKDFGIKTLDEKGEVIHGLEHEVFAVLLVDDKELSLRKIYKEKWTKRRGEAERILTGHETNYWVDDVPVKKSEYQNRISELINEDVFKLLTNIFYFNQYLKWQERRELLLQIAGDVSDEVVFASSDKLKELKAVIGDKSINDYKKIINERITKLNNEIKMIPVRIDEIKRGMPDLNGDIDYDRLETLRESIKNQIENIDRELTNANKSIQAYRQKQSELFNLKQQLFDLKRKLEYEASREFIEAENKKLRLQEQILIYNRNLEAEQRYVDSSKSVLAKLEKEITDLRKQWEEVNAEKFEGPGEDMRCHTCGQTLPQKMIEETITKMEENFKKDKRRRLADISTAGKTKAAEKKNLEENIAKINSDIAEIKNKIETIQKEINSIVTPEKQEIDYSKHPEYLDLQNRIAALESELNQPVENHTDKLLKEKRELTAELEQINSTLNNRDVIESSKKRIEELRKHERDIADRILDMEKKQYLIEEFIKTKVNILESSINSKFKYARFKMFNVLVNGALEECCETLVDRVPFADANTASKINIGLDIINTLTKYYGITAPIFIDNRESVNDLIETDSQIVNLVVSKDKRLKVEVE